MASTYTTRIRIEKQADGENPNSWGDILNQNVIDLLDDAIGAYTTIGTSGSQIVGDNTLTTNNGASDEARSAALEIQGYVVSASAANVVLPAQSKFYIVHNKVTQTSSTGTLRIMNTGATATGFTVNTSTTGSGTFLVVTDGTNVRGLDASGLGFTNIVTKNVLTSIGEIEVSAAATITNPTDVNPKLLALSTTDIRYAQVSSPYTNTYGSTNIFTSLTEFNGEIKVSAGSAYSPLVTVAVSDTSIFAVDMDAGNNFVFQVSADSTLRQPDNLNVGQQGIIYVIQDATSGGKTLSFASDFKFKNGTVPTFTTSISAVDLFAYSIRSYSVSASVTSAYIDMVAIQDMKR